MKADDIQCIMERRNEVKARIQNNVGNIEFTGNLLRYHILLPGVPEFRAARDPEMPEF